jgi:hypothetical protein
MKKQSVLLAGALPLALILAGCAQIESTVGDITGKHSYSKNLTVDGKVDAADGSYSSIKVSDDFLNQTVNGGTPDGKPFVDIINPETGQKMSTHPPEYRERVTRLFFDEFIDSTALEGGESTLTEWKVRKVADNTIATTPFTKEWLDGVHGKSFPVLTTESIAPAGGLKFIHDGKPRMTDASLTFGETTWTRNDDGDLVRVIADWSVDYRITDATAAEMLKVQNKLSDGEVQNYLTDAAKDGSGENTLHVYGQAEWYLLSQSGELRTAPVYLISNPSRYSLESVVKPEFHTAAPTAPAAP